MEPPGRSLFLHDASARGRQQKPRRVSLPDESKHHRNTCPISYPLPVRMTRQHFRAGRATPHASAAPSVKRAFQSCAPIRALSLSLSFSPCRSRALSPGVASSLCASRVCVPASAAAPAPTSNKRRRRRSPGGEASDEFSRCCFARSPAGPARRSLAAIQTNYVARRGASVAPVRACAPRAKRPKRPGNRRNETRRGVTGQSVSPRSAAHYTRRNKTRNRRTNGRKQSGDTWPDGSGAYRRL